MGKRPRDELKSKHLPRARDLSDSSYDGHTSDSLDHKSKAPRLADQVVPDVAIDPYEAAVITLPAVVKERLLQLLRVGIATRYDVSSLKTCFFFSNRLFCTCWQQLNLRCITSLRELSESAAIAVLDQVYNVVFMLLFQFFPIPVAFSSSCLAVTGSLCYRVLIDMTKEHTLLHWFPRYRLSPALFPPPSSSLYGRPLLSRSSARKLEDITPSYRVPVSSMQYGPGTGSSLRLTPKEHPVERRQMKFDPFTGEPYKYDPFTGKPIKPELH
ncbi:hypothetical protein BHE74_00035854, partial [Ensete ventricosum]